LPVYGHTEPDRHILSSARDAALETEKKTALLMVGIKAMQNSRLIAVLNFN